MDRPIAIDWTTLSIHQGHYLPHWTVERGIYHIILRLNDSLPQAKLKQWQQERQVLQERLATAHRGCSEDEQAQMAHLFSQRVDEWLDQGHGACWLQESAVAALVANSLIHFNTMRYHLHAWCIMPSHVHVIVEPIADWSLSVVVSGWTSYTGLQANRRLNRRGAFWQGEPYDHLIRSNREYKRQVLYVYNNPDKAGLQGWPWRWIRNELPSQP